MTHTQHAQKKSSGNGPWKWRAWRSRIGRLLVTMGLLVALVLGSPRVGDASESIDIGTAIGEQRSLTLSDGSVVYLKDRTELRVLFSRAARDVFLFEGRAIFKVRHRVGRPLRVHVGSTAVQAISGQFDVNRVEDRAIVTVIKGKVLISDAILPTGASAAANHLDGLTVSAGNSVALLANSLSVWPTAEDPQEVATKWRRRLRFQKFTLAQIAAEFNRHNRRLKIHVKDEAAISGLYTGVFDMESPESLLDFLARDSRFTLQRTGIDVIVDVRPGPGGPRSSSADAMSSRN